jgi:hypothetical protein
VNLIEVIFTKLAETEEEVFQRRLEEAISEQDKKDRFVFFSSLSPLGYGVFLSNLRVPSVVLTSAPTTSRKKRKKRKKMNPLPPPPKPVMSARNLILISRAI